MSLADTHALSRPLGAPIDLGPTDKRDVAFHLSPYAPGCEHLHVNDRLRGLTVSNRRPGQALHALFERLGITADLLAVGRLENGETTIHRARDPDHVYAFVWRGLSFDETRRAHENLVQHLAVRGRR